MKGTPFDLKGFKLNPDGSYSKAKSINQPREEKLIPISYDFKDGNKATETHKLVFKWADKHISLNDWYSGDHWSKRNKIAKEWHSFFGQYLSKPYPKFDTYIITLEFNSRLDPSNCITMLKLCEDALQEYGIIKNDNKDNCKGLHIIPNLDMKKFSYKITVQPT